MAREVTLAGKGAAPGLALGPVVRLDVPGASRRAGAPEVEGAALRAALAQAGRDLAALAGAETGAAADILAFQVAMIEDEALAEPAFEAIAAGTPADAAWRAALDAEIEGYRAAGDEAFRARAADLEDIRDRVLLALSGGRFEAPPPGAVLIGEDLTPSRFLSADWSAGGAIGLSAGSAASHVAMLARARGVPMVVGLGRLPDGAREALVDGRRGILVADPEPQTRRAFDETARAEAAAAAAAERLRFLPARTAAGEAVTVLLNVADPAELDGLDPAQCDGIGLTRTEFLFEGRELPDEAAQLAVYARLVAWAQGRPVTIRTLDAGGDKPIAGLTPDGESNPFLGLRGIRLSLARPDILRPQLRALCRAAAQGTVKVMVPMVAVPAELASVAALLDGVVEELSRQGLPHRRPALGIMVETPAAALCAERFDADFYSIGSNDLTQYTLAAARDIAAVAHLNDAGNPAVLELIRLTVEAGRARGREVSLCGDAAADPALTGPLLSQGLRVFSVAPRAVAPLKAAIAAWPPGGGR